MESLTSGLQTRFFELRVDPESNVIQGTVMRYGDTADIPWFGKERFEPGAFGNVASLDLQLNLQHNRDTQVARTGGAGLEVMDSYTSLDFRAELDMNDPDAQRVMSKYRKGILRGASVEFMPDTYKREMIDGEEVVIHTKAELRGFGAVDRPAYPDSKLREEQETMDATEFKRMLDEALAERDKDAAPPLTLEDVQGAIATALAERDSDVAATITTAVNSAWETIRKDRAEDAGDDGERGDGMDDEEEDRPGKHGKTKREENIDALVQARADLLTMTRAILPSDFSATGKSEHDILVAAVGDEVDNASERSEDYLRAKVEAIVERREAAANRNTTTDTNTTVPVTSPVSVHQIVVERDRARRAAARQ